MIAGYKLSCLPAQECVLGFGPRAAAASDAATATVLTAAGACSRLQRLRVGMQSGGGAGPGDDLGMRCIPDNLAALGPLTSLDLHHCGLWGPQQLPANLVDLRLIEGSWPSYTLPASLGAMTALTRLTANKAQALPPVWPLRLVFLEVRCL